MLKRKDVEAKARVPIAYQKMIDMLSKLSADLSELLRTVDRTIKGFKAVDERSLHEDLKFCRKVKNDIELIKGELIDYISKAAPALFAKEEWMRLLLKLSGISDKAIGIMYRIEQLLLNKWEIPKEVHGELSRLSGNVVRILDECKLAITLIGIDVDKSTEACKRVESIERQIDEVYRRANFLIIRCPASFREILLLKDIAEMLEEISDTVESVVDDIRVILINLI